eukprot:SAG22_NODE_14637_length_369_cov_0.814815_1_plen_50_part_01
MQLVLTIILEGVQLSSLLLTHPAFVEIKTPATPDEQVSPPFLVHFIAVRK